MLKITNFLPTDKTPTWIDRAIRNPFILIGLAAVGALLTVPLVVVAWFLLRSYIEPLLANQLWFSLIMLGVALFTIINGCAICILAERKISAFIQDRKGPNRVGFWGLLQPIADGAKFLLKEEITPTHVDKPVFYLAPALAFVISLLGFVIIPWAGEITWPWMDPGTTVTTQVADLNVGILYILATGSLGVYGVVLAGWASNNKYAFFGGMRAAAQMISYEIPLGLALMAVLLLAGTLQLDEIVNQQAATGVWNAFLHPVAFILLLIASLAETNRAPFDLAECEQELVGGFHTEYSSMKFALFFLGEYAHMIIGASLITALFLGGWAPLPFMSWYSTGPNGVIEHTWWNTSWMAAVIKFHIFFGKVAVLMALYMIVRWTLPRFRFDQLMGVAWKFMVPVGVALVAGQGVLTAFGWRNDPRLDLGNLAMLIGVYLAFNACLVALVVALAGMSKSPITGRQDNLPPVGGSSTLAES